MDGLRLPERIIPVPGSISPQAQAALALRRPAISPFPPIDDKAAWNAYIVQFNAGMADLMRPAAASLPVRSHPETIAGVPVFVAEPEAVPAGNRDKALLYFHGGGLVVMGGECVEIVARMEAAAAGCRVYAVDYRNPPDHPYPAALNDCVAVYRALLERHAAAQLAIAGASGGGNLAASAPLKLRDLGVELPAAIGLFTPEIDLTESGDTFATNEEIDVVLRRGLPAFNALYADGHDLADPYVSPLFGDFTKGFPPSFIQSGTRDLFLSNSVRLHRALCRAGVTAELHVWEAMPHGGFGDAPEDAEMRFEFRRFLHKIAGWAAP